MDRRPQGPERLDHPAPPKLGAPTAGGQSSDPRSPLRQPLAALKPAFSTVKWGQLEAVGLTRSALPTEGHLVPSRHFLGCHTKLLLLLLFSH